MLRIGLLLLFLMPSLLGLAQDTEFTIEIANRAEFMQRKALDGGTVPARIDVRLNELPAGLDSDLLDQYMDVRFVAQKYKGKTNKLVLKGVGPNETKLQYTLFLEERTGELKIDGYESVSFTAWGVWVCTNSSHSPKHTCGEGQTKSLKECYQAHGCVF